MDTVHTLLKKVSRVGVVRPQGYVNYRTGYLGILIRDDEDSPDE